MTLTAPGVYVQLLGSAKVITRGVEVVFSNDKRHQLLAYLACTRDWVYRDKLADLFYSETTDLARQNLRSLLQRVQQLKWLEALEIERTRVRWHVGSDYADFCQAMRANAIDKVLDVYAGALLNNLESYEDNEFATWLELERERLHGQWRSVIFRKAFDLKAQRHYEQAWGLLRKLLDQDAFDEEALLAYIEALHLSGHTNQALRDYQTFAQKLQREMGLKPTSATQQLVQVLEQQRTMPRLTASGVAEPKLSLRSPVTSFVGREGELAEIARLLDDRGVRLLTLVGPGGIGKTRIALEAAHKLSQRYRDGVCFVALDALTHVRTIPVTIAEALNLRLQGQDDVIQHIIEAIQQKHLLLVLDNFEHLIEGARLVSTFIRACPELDVLVTSRERLNVEEEHLLSLEGLSVPKEDAGLDEAKTHDAIMLFVERAKRMHSSFVLTGSDLPAALKICHLVQGFPLGIELASVWVNMMSLGEIAGEIEKNLDFLASTSRNAVERHRSIRATFEYSWKLLTQNERNVLSRLTVFAGGFTKEAASFVAHANLAVLAALVDKSLIRVFEGRYDFHPLLAYYAAEKAVEGVNQQELQTKHLLFFLELIESANRHIHSSQEEVWLARLDKEYDNLQVALGRMPTKANPEIALRLVSGLRHFWRYRGYYSEARSWTQKVLAETEGQEETLARARALMTSGLFALFQGDYQIARSHYERALLTSRALQSSPDTAIALINLGIITIDQGDQEQATRYYQEALELARELSDKDLEYRALTNLGVIATNRGDHLQARRLYQAGLVLVRELDNKRELAVSLDNLGITAWHLNQYSQAQRLLEESLAVGRELQSHHDIAGTLSNLGAVVLDQGDHRQAYHVYREALELYLKLKDKWGIAVSFENFASLAVVTGHLARAARHWGVAASLRQAMNAPIPPNWRPRYERFVALAKEALEPAIFSANWQAGQKMGLDEAVTDALND